MHYQLLFRHLNSFCQLILVLFLYQRTSNKGQLVTFLEQEWIKEAPNILKSNQVLGIGGVRAFSVSQYMASEVTDTPELKGDLEEADPYDFSYVQCSDS